MVVVHHTGTMPRALPATLGPDILPRPELSALVLDGDVWPLDRTFHAVDEPDRPGLRADALFRSFVFDLSRRRDSTAPHSVSQRIAAASGAGTAFVASGLSAAWVHGAILNPPRVYEVLARAPARVPVPPLAADWQVAQAHIRDTDVCLRGGWPVLTELATAFALAKALIDARVGERPEGAASVDAGTGVAPTGCPSATRETSIRSTALVTIVRLAGVDTVQAYLAASRPRRGTRAHDAFELIARITRNLAADDLGAAERERHREQERERERERPTADHLYWTSAPSALELDGSRSLSGPRVHDDDEEPRLTEQKRLAPLADPRRQGAARWVPPERSRNEPGTPAQRV